MSAGVDTNAVGLYRAGGVSAVAIGTGYIAIIGLYVPMGAPPQGTEALLGYIAANTPSWWTILGLSVLTDLLFLPLAAALYAALKPFHRNAMLLAATCMVLFVVLDLALTWTNYAALISFSGRYAQAADGAQKAAVAAAAEYPAVVVGSGLLFFYNSLTLAAGTLVSGYVMRKGVFSKSTAYLGMTTGVLGIVSVVGPLVVSALSVMIVVASLLTTAWVLLVGSRLWRLGRPA